ncbi:MAG TPA: hypothetical protein VEY67_03650 [Candidatus Dormibacteraeota bacterium]|nr:hypothetical protein [Candidatus Dormibacteraeota bacterium]
MIVHELTRTPVVGSLAARLGQIRDRHRPLPRLADVFPGPQSGGRWIGLRAVPTDSIRGTAFAYAHRGRDFRPDPGHQPSDWQSRWSRLLAAERDQLPLPPVVLIRAGGSYWVVDGHNRVALAREHGQRWIDADVTEVDVATPRGGSGSGKEH